MCASWSGSSRWDNFVHYRHPCEVCGETRMVAVVPRFGERIRLCRSCYDDGFWKESRKHAHSHAEKGTR
jgi:ribosome-binding protein aMBF1 (putative translation factor)